MSGYPRGNRYPYGGQPNYVGPYGAPYQQPYGGQPQVYMQSQSTFYAPQQYVPPHQYQPTNTVYFTAPPQNPYNNMTHSGPAAPPSGPPSITSPTTASSTVAPRQKGSKALSIVNPTTHQEVIIAPKVENKAHDEVVPHLPSEPQAVPVHQPHFETHTGSPSPPRPKINFVPSPKTERKSSPEKEKVDPSPLSNAHVAPEEKSTPTPAPTVQVTEVVSVPSSSGHHEASSDVVVEESQFEEKEYEIPDYAPDQWSPLTGVGKKVYPLEFLAFFKNLCMDAPETLKSDPNLKMMMSAPRMVNDIAFLQQKGAKKTTKKVVKKSIVIPSEKVELNKAETPWLSKHSVSATPTSADPAEDPRKAVYAEANAALNKLTKDNFEKLSAQIIKNGSDYVAPSKEGEPLIDVALNMIKFVELVFLKALDQPFFSPVYAGLCNHICVLGRSQPNHVLAEFRKHLLNKCQQEFMRDRGEEKQIKDTIDGMKASTPSDPAEARKHAVAIEEEQYKLSKAKGRMLGNIKFIAELFKLSLVPQMIMHECITRLLDKPEPEEDEIECLCKLLETAGKKIDSESIDKVKMAVDKAKAANDEAQIVLKKEQKYVDDAKKKEKSGKGPKGPPANPERLLTVQKDAEKAQAAFDNAVKQFDSAKKQMDDHFLKIATLAKETTLGSRFKFMLQDVVDLRDRKWEHRMKPQVPLSQKEVQEQIKKEQEQKAAMREESRGDKMRPGHSGNYDRRGTPQKQQEKDFNQTEFSKQKYSLTRDNSDTQLRPKKTISLLSKGPQSNTSGSGAPKKGGNLYEALESPKEPATKESIDLVLKDFKNEHDVKAAIDVIDGYSNFEQFLVNGLMMQSLEANKAYIDLLRALVVALVEKKFITSPEIISSSVGTVMPVLEDVIIDAPQACSNLAAVIALLMAKNLAGGSSLSNDAVASHRLGLRLALDTLAILKDNPGIDFLVTTYRGMTCGFDKFAAASNENITSLLKSKGLEVLESIPRDRDSVTSAGPSTPAVQQPDPLAIYRVGIEKLVADAVNNKGVEEWIAANVPQDVVGSPSFVHVLAQAVMGAIMRASTCKPDLKSPTEKETRYEEEQVEIRSQLLRKFAKTPEQQLAVLCALQVLGDAFKFPMGLVDRWMSFLHDNDIVAEEVFLSWLSDTQLTHTYPKKNVMIEQSKAFFEDLKNTEA